MKILFIFFLVLLISSCKSSVPDDVLPPKKMQAVLWDVMQADAMAEYYAARDSTFTSLSKHSDYYQKVFVIHKISKEDFTRSLAYYENHPSSLKPILDSLQSFGQRLQKADTIKKSSPPVFYDSNFKKRHLPIKRH
jgi:hypothetical protein